MNTSSISGTIFYRERILLRPGSRLEIALEDVSRADAPALVIAEQAITDPGQVPVSFELPYEPSAIDERMSYSMRARILGADDQLLFINDTHIPVLTRGAGSEVEIMLVAVKAPEPQGMELQGMFQYFADAALFRDCSTGKRFPVEMSGEYIELERAYLNSGIEPGSELKVSLRGRYLEREPMEGNTNIIKLIVDVFNQISDDQDCTPSHHAELVNTYWRLVELNNAIVRPTINQKEPHMVLHTGDQRLAGNGGCNTFFGNFALDGDKLSFSAMGSTMMACPDGMETEQSFLLALAETDRAVVSGQFLEIFKGEQKLARFEAIYL
jgi:copper homeostasis protein (lipoprotein)